MKNTQLLLRALPLLLLCGFITACSQPSVASNDTFPSTAIQSSAGSEIRPINLMDF